MIHSIAKEAVESEKEFICGALPGILEEPILIDKGFRTKGACMTFGIVQNMMQEYLIHSVVKGEARKRRS